jgi:hypothetical protein
MLTKHESQMLSFFDVRPYSHYKHRKKASLARPSKLNQYMKDRVNKLRELYSKHEPEYEYEWILPEGETDGRKSIKTEIIVGEDISPFDLEDFEELMPSIEDYIED